MPRHLIDRQREWTEVVLMMKESQNTFPKCGRTLGSKNDLAPAARREKYQAKATKNNMLLLKFNCFLWLPWRCQRPLECPMVRVSVGVGV